MDEEESARRRCHMRTNNHNIEQYKLSDNYIFELYFSDVLKQSQKYMSIFFVETVA